MEFGLDEDKRRSNIVKHRLDFLAIRAIFDGRPRTRLISRRGEEERIVSTAELDGRIITVVWVERGDAVRLISARGARDAEKRAYRSTLERRNR